MKKFTLITIITLGFFTVNAQQLPQYSQYMFNQYLLNPAVAGTEDDMSLYIGYRAQWAGFEDAPRTGIVSMHTKFKRNHGAGFYLLSDKTGPTLRTGAQLSYAYHLTLNSSGTKLGFGLAAQIFQHSLSADKLTTDQPGDVALQQSYVKTTVPDAVFGLWLYDKKYYAGISIPQLLERKIDYNGNQTDLNMLKRHYFVTGGYKFRISDDLRLEPSLLGKYVAGAPLQIDMNAKGYFKENFWVGASYRNGESVVGMLGVKSDFISAGYAYDFTLSDLRKYSSGSNEIFVKIRIVEREKPSPPAVAPSTSSRGSTN